MKRVLKIFLEIIFIFMICNIYLGLLSKVQAASVSVSGGSVEVGNTITVNFTISDNGGGFSGTVSYDSNKLNIVSSSDNGSNISFNNSTGAVAVFGANSFSVTFKATAEGNATVSLTDIILGNDDKLPGASSTIVVKSSNTQPPQSDNSGGSTIDSNSSGSNGGGVNSSGSSSNNSSQTPKEKEPTFKSVNDTIYATKSINVRSSWSTSSSIIGGLSKNQSVTRTGIGDNGWSRITYNGKTAYVSTSLITTTKPQEDEEKPEEKPVEKNDKTENSEKNSVNNNISEETDELKEENAGNAENGEKVESPQKTDDELYQELISAVGTIPEVGKNYNIYVFLVVCLISIVSVVLVFKKDISK